MSSYSEFHVEFNGHSPMNRNDPQQVEIFGPAGLEKNVNKGIAEFSSVFAQSGVLHYCSFTLVRSLIQLKIGIEIKPVESSSNILKSLDIYQALEISDFCELVG